MRKRGPYASRPRGWRLVLQDWSITLGILLLCTLIGFLFLLAGHSESNMISVYILGVLVIASATSHKFYGLFSAVMGVLLFNCIFADPMFTLLVYDKQYNVIIVLMLIASLTVSTFTTRFRSQLDREAQQSRQMRALLAASQFLLQASTPEDIFQGVSRQLHNLLDRTLLVWMFSQGDYQGPEQAGGQVDAAAERIRAAGPSLRAFLAAHRGERQARFDQDGLVVSLYFLRFREVDYGALGVVLPPGRDLTTDEASLLQAILDEVTLALERYQLSLTNQHILMEAEAERLRSNLLRAVSHDLRTPLTSISGSADILLSSGEALSPSTRQNLYRDIHEDAEWLIQLVENLLFITRIENGTMELHMEPEFLQDVILEAVEHMDKRKKNHSIQVEVPDDLLTAKVDVVLITQVLINLIDNAIKYTPPGSHILISAVEEGDWAIVEVSDDGNGFQEKEHMFDLFYTSSDSAPDGRRGIGLGLGLCKIVVEAHGGRIYARDNNPKGLVVGFTLKSERTCAG